MTFWYDGDLFEDDLSEGRKGEGRAQPTPLDNAGLRFGATVFTTLRLYDQDLNHPLTQWQGHCDRLIHSVRAFHWSPPHWPTLTHGCQQLAAHYPILRITLFPDGREWITGRALPPNLLQHQKTGVTCWVAPSDYARSLPTHKTGNYLACWLARQEAQRRGASEAILTSAEGDWLETSTGNLWGWAKGQWWTPQDSRCLPGVMQNRLRKSLTMAGRSVSTAPWHKDWPKKLEAIAYSNCAIELVPIHTIQFGTTKLEYNLECDRLKALQAFLTTAHDC
ncbi:MAG: aminotransferase class IV [Phormidesmis sp.]